MPKKRLIFTLLYEHDRFVLSRNFRLQKVGDLNWLLKNYNFQRTSQSIDELIILDISRQNKNFDNFLKSVSEIAKDSFVPICVGGGVDNILKVKKLFDVGVDKVLFNTILYKNPLFVESVAMKYGVQSVVASVDIRRHCVGEFRGFIESGSRELDLVPHKWLNHVHKMPVGEILINSIDRDGTGMGLDFNLLSLLPEDLNKPVILSGGIGNADHILDALLNFRIDAVATANLLNFIGNGLATAREKLYLHNCYLPRWQYLSEIA
jgi:cyclase